MRIPTICPKCNAKVIDISNKSIRIRSCSQCGLQFSYKKGILSFCGDDDFYEGRFTATVGSRKSFLRKCYDAISISSSHIRFIQKSLRILPKQENIILDIGCGGGHQFLNDYGYVVGVDLSISSLLNAKTIYLEVYHCNALSLPFEDSSFDLVFSNQLLGHIPLDIKGKVIEEMYRVTKPGGLSLHTIECDSNAAYFKWAKRYPELFTKYFVDMYGHYGLELPTENFKRFRKAGFKPIREIAVPSKGYIREVASYSIWFDNEYKSHSKTISLLASVATLLNKNKIVAGLTNTLLCFTTPIANLVTPKDCRDSVEVLYQK